jgi:hypothetical protein
MSDQEDVVIYDSSLTLSQLKGLWGNNGDFSEEELDKLASDINDAIHTTVENFLNWRKP